MGKGIQINLRPGVKIRYKIDPHDAWKYVEVIGKAGKETGKNNNWYNVTDGYNWFSLNLEILNIFEKVSGSNSTDFNLENDMREKWTTVDSPIAFSGVSKIYDYYNKDVNKKEIERVLSTIPTYTKYKQRKRSNLNNPFFIYYINQQWQADITFVNNLKEYNDNISFLLVVMECFSRKIFVAPMKTKSTAEVIEKFDNVRSYIDKSPHTLYVDKGSEFNSGSFKDYCKEYNIRVIFSESTSKAALVERAQRTLQGIMYKFMNQFSTKRYIDSLDKIVSSFNSRVNRTIKMSPNNAYLEHNYTMVMKNLELYYQKALQRRKKAKYKVGDRTRIYIIPKEGVFRKGYTPIFSSEIFTIYAVNTRLPEPRYYIKDESNNKIVGSFQAQELSIVRI